MRSMNFFKEVQFVLFTFFLGLFFLTGCGYKPSTHYAKKELSGKVFVNLHVDLKDPRNSVIIKDAMNELLIQKLGSKLVYKKSEADTIMNLKVNSAGIITLSYDRDGYIKLYRAIVGIKVDYFKKDTQRRKSITVDGEYNFSIDDGSTISDTKRFNAIKVASDEAMEEVLSRIAVQSFQK